MDLMSTILLEEFLCERRMVMNELLRKLQSVSDTYFGFVAGVLAYTNNDSSKITRVMDYINENKNCKSSDILDFICSQPDFYEACDNNSIDDLKEHQAVC